MSAVKLPEVEMFGEVHHLNDAGHSNEVLRFGYRVAGTDTVLASIAVPLSVVQGTLPREVSARLDPNGTIYVSSNFMSWADRHTSKRFRWSGSWSSS
jgi:hypothetical protein